MVVAHGRDPLDPRPPQQQRERQRALVRRAQQGGVGDARGPDALDELAGRALGHRHPLGLDPRRVERRHGGDPGEQVGRRPTPGAAEQVHRPAGRRDRSDRRTGRAGRRPGCRGGRRARRPPFGLAAWALTARRAETLPPRAAPGSRPTRTRSIAVPKSGTTQGAAATSSAPGDRGGDEDRGRAGGGGGLDVGADVADHGATCDRHGEHRSGGGDHPGPRLAAGAPVAGPVWAPQPRVERPEQLVDPGVHRPDLIRGHDPGATPLWLDTTASADAGRPQAVEAGGGRSAAERPAPGRRCRARPRPACRRGRTARRRSPVSRPPPAPTPACAPHAENRRVRVTGPPRGRRQA